MEADLTRTNAPANAHVRLSPKAWTERSARLLEAEWTVWDLPEWVRTVFERVTLPNNWNCSAEYEHNVFAKLYPHQRDAVRVGVQSNGSVFLADSMGLGKTRVALALAAYYAPTSLLVVAPAALRSNWVYEARQWFPELTNVTCGAALAQGNPPPFAVVSYSLLAKVQQPYAYYIFDESHYLKNAAAARTRAALKTAKVRSGVRVILLSGTPLSRNSDLYAQLRVLGTLAANVGFYPFLGRYGKTSPAEYFAYRYTRPEVTYTPREVVRFGRNDRSWELSALLSSANVVRRTKEDVGLNLPPKVRETCVVGELSSGQRSMFERELRGSSPAQFRSDARLMHLVLRTAEMKRTHTLAYVREMLSSHWLGDKVLLFAHYHATLDALADLCRELGVACVSVDGRCSALEKDERLENFRKDDSVVCAILGLQCASVGLNLPNANRVVFAELGWNPDDYLQAEDRAHRLGCVRPVHVIYLLLQHSTDSLMYSTLRSKLCNTALVLDEVATQEFLPPLKRTRV